MSDTADRRRRLRELADHGPRDEYFALLRQEIETSYFADPESEYRLSGRSSGAARWEETRRCIADAIDRNGDFMDVGCANGLLLESLLRWSIERGLVIRPHGINFVPRLVERARNRFPDRRECFEVANVHDWVPRRRYTWVRTNVEFVPRPDLAPCLRRLVRLALEPGGRLIVCHYRNPDEPVADVAGAIERCGWLVKGTAAAPGVAVAWTDLPARPMTD